MLGQIIDEMHLQDKTVLGLDIGCSLLAWDYFDFATAHTHHGRTTATSVGYKIARPEKLVFALMGDGGGYAIGLQNLIHAAIRNNPITAIVLNNTCYAMTGGQLAPTTLEGEITSTTPEGRNAEKTGAPFFGPELIRSVANQKSYIARASISQPILLKKYLKSAIEKQLNDNTFSFVEVLSICPTNWKMDAKESFEFNLKMQKIFPCKEFI
ncbi:MAG: thiamine pyrophosphate-dependent enzyme [Patescibacteria group bacterium]|nr:thiamine pyrophosphate-dependent enzyme [Patescibacteria group bacterium]